MAANAVELAVQRQATTAFIQADVTSVILNRADLLPNGAGGKIRSAGEPRDPLTCRLIPVGVAYGGAEVHEMLDGQTVQVHYHLLADWDADVEVGDWFFRDGHKHEILWVRVVGDYEKKAGVTDRG